MQVDAGAGVTAFRVQPHPRRLEVLLPCILFGLRAENSPLMSEVAMNLHFAPQLQDMASRVMREASSPSPTAFLIDKAFLHCVSANAVHHGKAVCLQRVSWCCLNSKQLQPLCTFVSPRLTY